MSEENSLGSRVVTVAGVIVAGTGVAHFVRPQLFDDITVQAFPRNSRRNLYINGGIETAIGVGLAVPRTRRLAVAGLLAYGAYLAGNVARNR